MKKLSIILAIAFSMCLALFALSGCGGGDNGGGDKGGSESSQPAAPSDEQVIAGLMADNVAEIESQLGSIADQLSADESMAELFNTVGLDPKEYGNAIAAMISAKVGDIKVDGDTAVAELVLTVPDYEAISAKMDASLEEILADPNTASMTEEQLYAEVGKAIMDAISSPDGVTKEATLDVEYAKTGDEWKVQNWDDIQKAMTAAFSG